MSSHDVVKTVSKKLKYYFEIKRREDGFDLTGPDCPRLDHPPLRARPTLMYDGLHDRPLKHYFSPRSAKTVLTQFKVPEGKSDREKTVKKKLEKNMRRYQFVYSSLPDTYYKNGKSNRRTLRPETVGYGVPLKSRKSAHKGSYPVLRSTPPDYLTKGEVNRLVNMATKLLVATETVDLKEDDKENSFHSQKSRPSTAKSYDQRSKRLPQIEEDNGKQKNVTEEETKKPKYTYDIHGRRVKVTPQKSEDEVDSSYGTRPSSTHNSFMTINGEVADDKKVPVWLKKQMGHQNESSDDERWVRPHSANVPSKKSNKRPPSGKQRPKSAAVSSPKAGKTKKEHKPAKPKDLPFEVQPAAWDLEVCSSAPADSDDQLSNHNMETGVQTPGELLREYDPMEKIIWDGERCRYRVHVFTGNRLGASTKADVKIVLCGDNGRIEEQWLQDCKNNLIKFQKGREDIFELETFYVGPLRKILIGHDRPELGYGWYVDKVYVKDCMRNIRYEIPCQKWLSSKEGDGSTVKVFDVKISTMYNEDDHSEEEHTAEDPGQTNVYMRAPSPREDKNNSKQEEKECVESAKIRGEYMSFGPTMKNEYSESHTSVNTIPSETQDRLRKNSTASSYSSTSSSYESDPRTDTDASSTPRAKSPAVILPTRKDDFFDQNVPEKDYASVIESITERENDFIHERYTIPTTESTGIKSRNNNYHGETATLTLKGISDEDENHNYNSYNNKQAVVKPQGYGQVQQSETETESDTARLSVANDTDRSPKSSKPEEDYMEGFKAGIEAANKSAIEKEENEAIKKENETTKEGEIMRGPSISTAAKTGDLERVKTLVSHNSALKTCTNEKGWTPLHISASHGHKDVLQWLCVHVTDLDIVTPTGYTPVHLAAMNGHTGCVQVLAAMGALIGSETVEKQSALHLAAMGGHIETVKWLVANRASLKIIDNMDRTALDVAEQNNKKEVVAFLKACYEEKDNPNSSLSQLRKKSKSIETSSTSSSDSSSDTSDSSSSSDSSSDSSASETWSNDKRPTSSKRPASSKENHRTPHVNPLYKDSATEESELDEKIKQKHDEEIEAKRQMYEEQQTKMAQKQTSFLDSIRDEYS